MAQTNRIPLGFLDLVGAETGGKNPPEYADVLTPNVDLTELYLAQTLGAEDLVSNVHSNTGDVFEVRVPTDETWLLRAVGINVTLTTGNFEQWAFDIRQAPRMVGGPLPIFWTSNLLVPNAPVMIMTDAFYLPTLIALSPGTILRGRVTQRDGGMARSTRINYLISRLR